MANRLGTHGGAGGDIGSVIVRVFNSSRLVRTDCYRARY